MAIGLKADCALVNFQSGNAADALQLMHEAILDTEQLKPEASEKAKFCRLCLSQLTLWMQLQVTKNVPVKCDFHAVVGHCSNPDPQDKVMSLPCPPLLAVWYHLAVLALMLRKDLTILAELRSRTSTQKILSCELILNHYIIAKYVITVDIENFFSYLQEYVSKAAYMREEASSVSKENIYDLTDSDLPAIKAVDWTSDLHLQLTKDAILALAATAICSNAKNIREQMLNYASQNQKVAVVLREFIDCFEKETCPKGKAYDIYAFHLGCLMNVNIITPDKMFIITYRLWEWLTYTNFKAIVENMIAHYLARHWQKIIEHQKFNLQQPMITVPDIEAAIEESAGGTVKIAKLLLAAEFAVKRKLDATLLSKLKEHCLQNHKGDTS